ncbi:MAG TPA: hypothetical protein VL549_11480 [Gemmatimonadales bacterium]|nr:hypothetical protein [Gemmatimonadales bacterium]
MRPIQASGALLLLCLAGCATAPAVRWNREDLRPIAVKGDRQLERVKFWSGDSTHVWHWVVITPDSIRGYPDQPTGQVRFRALPLSVIDSLVVGYPENDQDRTGKNDFLTDLGAIGFILLALLTP